MANASFKFLCLNFLIGFCLMASTVVTLQAAPIASLPMPIPLHQRQVSEKFVRDRERERQNALPAGSGYYEGEDWTTQGNWVGRYGRQYAVLCASGSPCDHYIVDGKQFYTLKTTEYRQVLGTPYSVFGQIGPHSENNDSMRHWVQWLKSDDPRVLFDPVVGYRREAEWDDHGEAYARSFEGPDLWVAVAVPQGLHRISFYFFNKDGHDSDNRDRDYTVEMRLDQSGQDKTNEASLLARTRVVNFWNGVYKKFVVRGPGIYSFKIGKNSSLNTILQAIMIDAMSNSGH